MSASSLGAAEVDAWIGLGANLGDVRNTLAAAVRDIASLPRTRLRDRSSWFSSAPIEAAGDDYLNAVVRVATRLDATALLRALQAIELRHGRERPHRNAPRTLDLDLLLYGDEMIADPDLIVPHPRLHQRAFVLAPIAELAPGLVIPGRGKVAALLDGVGHQRVARLDR